MPTPNKEWIKEFDEHFGGRVNSLRETLEADNRDNYYDDIKSFIQTLLDKAEAKSYEQGKADERERIVEGWKEPNRLAYERGKADGMEEEAIGCFDHSQRDLSDYKKGLVELCCKDCKKLIE